MGGVCSRTSNIESHHDYADSNGQNGKSDRHNLSSKTMVSPPAVVGVEEERKFPGRDGAESVDGEETPRRAAMAVGSDHDEFFYDGIPRYSRALSRIRSSRSTQAAVAKVSEVSSRLGRAGTAGFGMAVEVLDTLGSSMTIFNSSAGFTSTAPTKTNEIAILSFEIANTIVKGSNLMQSLSKRSIRQLKEEVLPSKGIQQLISEHEDELLKVVAADKREELKIFAGEVIRFGNRSKDPQWHNLDRYFEKVSNGVGPQRDLEEEADSGIHQLMTLVQHTAELYHELHALDRFEQEFHRKNLEAEVSTASQKEKGTGDNLSILRSDLKAQRKIVKSLKKKSLWSKTLEEVMEKLVDIVHFLHLEILTEFGRDDAYEEANKSGSGHNNRLGPAGLSLHYANMVIQIDTLVARSSNMPINTRESLYQGLPPNIKSSLRSKLKSFHVEEVMTIKEIKDEMEKTLGWLVPVATNTAKAHHGFGWVGEWANTGSDGSKKAAPQAEIMRIETLHHADKDKTEACLLDMLLWLHHLAVQTKLNNNPESKNSVLVEPKGVIVGVVLTSEDHEMLNALITRKKRISKSLDFDETCLRDQRSSLGRSRSYSHPPRGTKEESGRLSRLTSGIRIPEFSNGKEKVLDIIDRVEMWRR